MFSGTEWVVLDPPLPLPANPPSGPGLVNEIEPNDTLGSHQAIALGTTVQASLAVGDLAVRGDGIEVVYRIDLGSRESSRIDLSSPSGQNLDFYVLTEDLRVLNETHQGTSPGATERVCLELVPGPCRQTPTPRERRTPLTISASRATPMTSSSRSSCTSSCGIF